MGQSVGQRIRSSRKTIKMTQQELADKSGMAVNSIRRYEGEKVVPRVTDLQKIATALGADVNYLANGLQTIGQRVRDRRESLGMALEQLAEKSGYEVQTIVDRERDKIVSNREMLERLAAALDCSVAYLTYAGGEPNLAEVYGPNMTTDDMLDGPEVLKGAMNNDFDVLNRTGQKEAQKRVHELTQIPKYTEE